jgi:hypothetical protein
MNSALKEAIFEYKNVNYLCDLVIDKLNNLGIPGVTYTKSQPFIDNMDKIMSAIYTAEESSNQDLPLHLRISKLNNIIFSESVKYFSSKVNGNVSISKQPNEINELKKFKDLKEIKLLVPEKVYYKPEITGITKINIENINLYNKDYNVTSDTNKLVLSMNNVEHTIVIESGNYTPELLVKELQDKIRTKPKCSNISCFVNDVNGKFIIANGITFENDEKCKQSVNTRISNLVGGNFKREENIFDIVKKKSTILDILGFGNGGNELFSDRTIYISTNPIKLIKKHM